MSRIAHAITEVTNVAPDTHQPYVGVSAFAHKAGLHARAIKVDPKLYQHIDPALVGNDMRMLVSDMAGRASVELKGRELGYDLSGDKDTIGRVAERVKDMEARGYTFEAADASLRAAAARRARPAARVLRGRVLAGHRRAAPGRRGDQRGDGEAARQGRAHRRHRRGQRPGQRAGQGAARRRWSSSTPSWPRSSWSTTRCASWRARTAPARSPGCSSSPATAPAKWTTVGVDENIIAASWHALEEAVTYGLLRSGREPG